MKEYKNFISKETIITTGMPSYIQYHELDILCSYLSRKMSKDNIRHLKVSFDYMLKFEIYMSKERIQNIFDSTSKDFYWFKDILHNAYFLTLVTDKHSMTLVR